MTIIRASRRTFLMGTGALAANLAFPRFAFAEEEKKLNFYNYDTYIGETTLVDFKEATGIEVKLDLFADMDELFAKLKEGNPGYDVIVTGPDYLEKMIIADMVLPLDHSKIPNMTNIDEPFKDATFDPGRKHSVPYMWGTLGIGYRKSKVEATVDSWKFVLDDPRYAGRISLLGDAQNVLGPALKYLGYSFNSINPKELKEAEELLIQNKKYVKVYADDNGQDLLVSGEVDLAEEWNGDVLQVMADDKDIAYSVPTEGSLLWQDALAIPKGAPHPENAHAFMNFILDGQVGAEIAKTIQYATTNAAAKKLMSKEYRENPAIFPPPEVIAKCEANIYLGEEATRLRDEAWTRIMAA